MTSEKKEYEDIEDTLGEMEEFWESRDVTYNMRCNYASRIRAALSRHDTKLMMDFVKATIPDKRCKDMKFLAL